MTNTIQEGGCACGAVRFSISAEPAFTAHCHCRDCQKMTGAHMATVAGIPESGFELTQGEPRAHITIGESGKEVYRRYCSECGSTLYSTAVSAPGMVFVEAGSLDDASGLQPSMHIFTRSAQPWARIPSDMPSFAAMPTG
ncbi:MAG: GFA family protein [Lysobacterales bacterium]|jgi:hypothetical protein